MDKNSNATKTETNRQRDIMSAHYIPPSTGHIELDQVRTAICDASAWKRGNLSIEDRIICSLSYIFALKKFGELESVIQLAVKSDLTFECIPEVLIQVCLYNGFSDLNTAVEKIEDISKKHGQVFKVDTGSLSTSNIDELTKKGKELQAKIHGPRSSVGHANPDDSYTNDLYSIATTYGYGLIWSRPGLDLRSRFIVALSSFVALSLPDSYFSKFARSAVTHGLSVDEIVEIVVHGAFYAGFPKGLAKLMMLKFIFPSLPSQETCESDG